MPTLTQLPTGEDDDEHEKLLDEEKFKDFVADFSKHFEDLAKFYKKDAEKIKILENVFGKSILRYSTILQKMKMKLILTLAPQRRLNLP